MLPNGWLEVLKSWDSMFQHCVLTEKKNLQKSGWPPHCKGCPEWLKKANDSIKDLKLNVSSLCFDSKKNQRKSGCTPLQRVPRMIEKSQWSHQSPEIEFFHHCVVWQEKLSAKIWEPPHCKNDWKKPMIFIKVLKSGFALKMGNNVSEKRKKWKIQKKTRKITLGGKMSWSADNR